MKTPLLLATRNRGKRAELEALLREAGLAVSVLTLEDFPGLPPVEEDGRTLEENARKKAEHAYAHTGIPALADDSGLEVEALDGEPGVRSARFAGPNATDADNNALLLARLAGIGHRRARFRCVLAYADGLGVHLYEGCCAGRIAEAGRGEHGFGYDPLFVPDGFEQTFAELEPQLKNRISHRGRAFEAFLADLRRRLAASTGERR
ncbi:MAG: RdgB/HAM1 family non-canonical purine NTP pyrophosphatase [Bacteroidetes bacterium]|nr:RdgB/HAM1 family non-canonical purine NTP pyrophosphatase [Bacteroidota bacterium]